MRCIAKAGCPDIVLRITRHAIQPKGQPCGLLRVVVDDHQLRHRICAQRRAPRWLGQTQPYRLVPVLVEIIVDCDFNPLGSFPRGDRDRPCGRHELTRGSRARGRGEHHRYRCVCRPVAPNSISATPAFSPAVNLRTANSTVAFVTACAAAHTDQTTVAARTMITTRNQASNLVIERPY